MAHRSNPPTPSHWPFLALAFYLLAALASEAALRAYYLLDETNGNAADSSGNSYHATPVTTGSGLSYGQTSPSAGTYGALSIDARQAAAFVTSIDFGTDAANSGYFTLDSTGNAAVASLLAPGSGGNAIDGSTTVSAWIFLDSVSAQQTIFSSGSARTERACDSPSGAENRLRPAPPCLPGNGTMLPW